MPDPNDAFGAAHRAHASVEAIVRLVKDAGAGLLMDTELRYLGEAVGNPQRPYVAILGGAKVSDKIEVIDNLIPKVDRLIIGGAMAYTFFKAMGKPVGKSLVEDDKLELARDIAQKFNNDYGASIKAHGFGDAFFPLPEPLISGPATRVMSLRDGTKKMSKSDVSDLSRIHMTDDADAIGKKIQKAKTDMDGIPSEEAGLAGRPEADNLVGVFAALSGRAKADVLAEFGGANFSTFKNALVDVAVAKLAPITAQMRRIREDEGYIDGVLRDGSERARAIARENMNAVKDIVGFLR